MLAVKHLRDLVKKFNKAIRAAKKPVKRGGNEKELLKKIVRDNYHWERKGTNVEFRLKLDPSNVMSYPLGKKLSSAVVDEGVEDDDREALLSTLSVAQLRKLVSRYNQGFISRYAVKGVNKKKAEELIQVVKDNMVWDKEQDEDNDTYTLVFRTKPDLPDFLDGGLYRIEQLTGETGGRGTTKVLKKTGKRRGVIGRGRVGIETEAVRKAIHKIHPREIGEEGYGATYEDFAETMGEKGISYPTDVEKIIPPRDLKDVIREREKNIPFYISGRKARLHRPFKIYDTTPPKIILKEIELPSGELYFKMPVEDTPAFFRDVIPISEMAIRDYPEQYYELTRKYGAERINALYYTDPDLYEGIDESETPLGEYVRHIVALGEIQRPLEVGKYVRGVAATEDRLGFVEEHSLTQEEQEKRVRRLKHFQEHGDIPEELKMVYGGEDVEETALFLGDEDVIRLRKQLLEGVGQVEDPTYPHLKKAREERESKEEKRGKKKRMILSKRWVKQQGLKQDTFNWIMKHLSTPTRRLSLMKFNNSYAGKFRFRMNYQEYTRIYWEYSCKFVGQHAPRRTMKKGREGVQFVRSGVQQQPYRFMKGGLYGGKWTRLFYAIKAQLYTYMKIRQDECGYIEEEELDPVDVLDDKEMERVMRVGAWEWGVNERYPVFALYRILKNETDYLRGITKWKRYKGGHTFKLMLKTEREAYRETGEINPTYPMGRTHTGRAVGRTIKEIWEIKSKRRRRMMTSHPFNLPSKWIYAVDKFQRKKRAEGRKPVISLVSNYWRRHPPRVKKTKQKRYKKGRRAVWTKGAVEWTYKKLIEHPYAPMGFKTREWIKEQFVGIHRKQFLEVMRDEALRIGHTGMASRYEKELLPLLVKEEKLRHKKEIQHEKEMEELLQKQKIREREEYETRKAEAEAAGDTDFDELSPDETESELGDWDTDDEEALMRFSPRDLLSEVESE